MDLVCLVGVDEVQLDMNSLQDWAHLFCRTGKGFAAENVVQRSSLFSMQIMHMYFAAQEKELPLNNS